MERWDEHGSRDPASVVGAVSRDRTRRWLGVLTMASAVLPSLVAIVRAWANGWIATADNAISAIRSLDVMSLEHHPLVGTLSSVSVSVESTVHHPGPLLFDVLALPAHLFGSDVGIPLGVGLVNAGCAAWVVHLAGRLGGLTARLVASVVVALLSWTMGWALLIEPWNPHAAMLPGLLFLVACGALTAGTGGAALPAVVGGSLCLQAHIGYGYVVAFALLVSVALRWRARHVRSPSSRVARVVPFAVLVVLWSQPLLDLVVNRGDSNVAAILGVGSPGPTIGPTEAIRVVAAKVAIPPWWLPAGFDRPAIFHPPPPMGLSVPALLAVEALLVLVAWRGRSATLRWYGRYVAILLPLMVVALALIPSTEFGPYTRHHWRWVWTVSAVTTFVLGWAVAAELHDRLDRRLLIAATNAACASTFVLSLTASPRELRPEQQEFAAIDELIDRLPFVELGRCEHVIVDYEAGFEAPALVAPSVMLALRERNIDFAPTAGEGIGQLNRRPPAESGCRLSLTRQQTDGRAVGALAEPLLVFVTFTP